MDTPTAVLAPFPGNMFEGITSVTFENEIGALKIEPEIVLREMFFNKIAQENCLIKS